MTNRELLNDACERLGGGGVENAAFDSAELMGKALRLDCRSGEFKQALEMQAESETKERLTQLVERRLGGEPLQYIIGEWEFYGLPFFVGEGVLIPRQDTETLVELAIDGFKGRKKLRVADLCAGTGCIGLALEKHLDIGELTLVEKSEEAVKYLEKNLVRNSSGGKIVKGDVLEEETAEALGEADLIVCNPPYLTAQDMAQLQKEVSFEPESALFGGEDGLDFYRAIVRIWKRALADGGEMYFEIGASQEDEVMEMLIQHGFTRVRCKKDPCGIVRVVHGVLKKD